MWFSKEIKSLPQTPIFYSLPTSLPPDVVLNFDITNLKYLSNTILSLKYQRSTM